jgi:REP element-mobilizing transposase RayT
MMVNHISISEYKKFGVYHVYNRGHRKGRICLEAEDYYALIRYLRKAENNFDVTILCYCIMRNHYHLILKLGSSKSDISRMMHKSMTCYGMYFNRKYGFSGSIFQGSFKCREVEYGGDLENLIKYIKNNPEKEKIHYDGKKYRWLYVKRVLPRMNLKEGGHRDSEIFDLW